MDGCRSLLFLYPHPAAHMLEGVKAGELPSERLYGLVELGQLGWNVSISDARWTGPLNDLRARVRRFVEIPSLRTLSDMREADIIMVKDEFSSALLLQARALGKRIVYLDSMFELPRRVWRRWSARLNMTHADLVICYSHFQQDLWRKDLELAGARTAVLPYCVDVDFYAPRPRRTTDPPFLIAVGRDTGREFSSLIEATRRLRVDLKLVTLPYLVPPEARGNPGVQILENLSYGELFDLYSRSAASVVPLKQGITYPSGIRAVIESLLLAVPTVATLTPVLTEYAGACEHVHFADAENIDALTETIGGILANRAAAEDRAIAGSAAARELFSMHRFAEGLAKLLMQL